MTCGVVTLAPCDLMGEACHAAVPISHATADRVKSKIKVINHKDISKRRVIVHREKDR